MNRVGFTNGCFDLLHKGHLHFLKQCRDFCDDLIVGIDNDLSVRQLKGAGRPVQTLDARVDALWLTGLVDSVHPFDDAKGLLSLLRIVKPQVLFKGKEYLGKTVVGSELVPTIILIDMLPGYSTTIELTKGL